MNAVLESSLIIFGPDARSPKDSRGRSLAHVFEEQKQHLQVKPEEIWLSLAEAGEALEARPTPDWDRVRWYNRTAAATLPTAVWVLQ